jgi:hypothetical protein
VKVKTVRGTYVVDMERMKVWRAGQAELDLLRVPTPVIGERMELETDAGIESTEQVTEVEL